jgi:hypothetical protein
MKIDIQPIIEDNRSSQKIIIIIQ